MDRTTEDYAQPDGKPKRKATVLDPAKVRTIADFPPDETYVRIEEIARKFNIPESTITSLFKRGEIPAIGGSVRAARFPLGTVGAWLQNPNVQHAINIARDRSLASKLRGVAGGPALAPGVEPPRAESGNPSDPAKAAPDTPEAPEAREASGAREPVPRALSAKDPMPTPDAADPMRVVEVEIVTTLRGPELHVGRMVAAYPIESVTYAGVRVRSEIREAELVSADGLDAGNGAP